MAFLLAMDLYDAEDYVLNCEWARVFDYESYLEHCNLDDELDAVDLITFWGGKPDPWTATVLLQPVLRFLDNFEYDLWDYGADDYTYSEVNSAYKIAQKLINAGANYTSEDKHLLAEVKGELNLYGPHTIFDFIFDPGSKGESYNLGGYGYSNIFRNGLYNGYGEVPYYYFDKPGQYGTGTLPLHFNFDGIGRSDVQLGGDTITSRYIFNRGNSFNSQDTTGYPINVTALSQSVLQSWTHNLSTHMVNEARVGFNRLNVNFGGNNSAGEFNWNFPVVQPITPVTGYSNPTYDFGADLGGPIVKDRLWGNYGYPDRVISQSYGGPESLNAPLPSTTWPTVPGSSSATQLDFREYDTFNYGGDDWKIRQSLTLSLGLTWTYYGQPANLFADITQARASKPSTPTSFGPSIGFTYAPQWGGFLTDKPSIARETLGFEKTFLGGDASVGLRVPFVQTERKENPLSFRIGGYGSPSPFSPSYNARGPWWSDPSIGGGPELTMPWLSWLNTAGVTGGGGASPIASLGTSLPGTFVFNSAAPGATFVVPPEWRVVSLEYFLKYQDTSSEKETPAQVSGGGPTKMSENLGPEDLLLHVDALGRVILSRGPWEIATLNAGLPLGRESGAASWMSAPLPGELPQVAYWLIANGNSSGKAFELQVQDPSGQFKRVVLPDGVVLEPAAIKDPEAKAAGQAGKLLTQEITAFCLEFAKLPPEAGMLYKIANPEKQRQYRAAHYALEAGYEMGANGEFNPDMDAKAYIDFTRQNAAWAIQGNWDEQQFTQHWIERTQKNAQAMHIAWSKQMEDALRAAAPNRWRDIDKVVKKARSMMQKEELAAAR